MQSGLKVYVPNCSAILPADKHKNPYGKKNHSDPHVLENIPMPTGKDLDPGISNCNKTHQVHVI